VRYLLLAAALVVVVAASVTAQSGTLSYTLNSPPTHGTTSATFNATIGGVHGTITTTPTTTTKGQWTMTVDGKTFASGTYACGGGSCRFYGGMLAGKRASFSMTKTNGTLPGLFANHGAWVSTVAHWANKNLSSGENRGQVVSQAAGGAEHDPSGDHSHDAGQSASGGDQGKDHGAGGDHGGGQGHSK